MQPIYKRVLLFVFVLLMLIQVFPGERPAVIEKNPSDIHQEVLIDDEVSNILKTSCYDCHSNETKYPWYTNVVPVSWLINHDVEEGREELNFSEWAQYSDKRKHHKLEELIEEVEEGEMPMEAYTFIHRSTKLNEQQIAVLTQWAKTEMSKFDLE
ncbi:MAG: heme-binding domain-containing protein [Cyclobacteriaceae bacterium]